MVKQITIGTILPGWSPSEYLSLPGQFLASVGVDPEMPKNTSSTRPSGLIRPTATANIANDLTGAAMWIEGNNKTSNTYTYNSDGKIGILDNALALTYANSGNALTGGAGNGMAYYNNYYYFAVADDVVRFGPMSTSPVIADDWWNGTLGLTALANATYPSINGIKIPNHPMYVDPQSNYLYFGDITSDNVGIINMIHTKKVTVEGDTNDTTVPSTYNNLDTYYGWWPTCIGSSGTMLAVGLIDGVATDVKQQNAKIVFWSKNPSDTSYTIAVDLPDPLITALKEVNGTLYIFTGNATGGMRISRYLGGNAIEEIAYFDDQFPPFQGAVDNVLNRIIFGSRTTTPIVSGSLFAFGGKSRAMGMGIHNILNSTAAGTAPMITAARYITQSATSTPVIAFKDTVAAANHFGIDKTSITFTSGKNVWRSEMFRVGSTFQIKRVRIPLAQAISANTSFTIQAYYDDGSATSEVRTVNNTNDSGKRFINWFPQTAKGDNNFFLEIIFTGTALCTLSLPILALIESELD